MKTMYIPALEDIELQQSLKSNVRECPRKLTSTDVTIGERIRKARLARGASQEKLADLLGVSSQQVQKYEKAENRISVSRLVRIAEALQLPISCFLPDDGDDLQPLPELSPVVTRLAEVAETLSEQRVMELLGFARIMAKSALVPGVDTPHG